MTELRVISRLLPAKVTVEQHYPWRINAITDAILCGHDGKQITTNRIMWLWCGHFAPFSLNPPYGLAPCPNPGEPARCFENDLSGYFYTFCRYCQENVFVFVVICGRCHTPLKPFPTTNVSYCPCRPRSHIARCRAIVGLETMKRRKRIREETHQGAEPTSWCTNRAAMNNGGYCGTHLSAITFRRNSTRALETIGVVDKASISRIVTMACVYPSKKRKEDKNKDGD